MLTEDSFTINRLSALLRFDRRTLTKRLRDLAPVNPSSKIHKFDLRDVFDALTAKQQGGALDPNAERARKDAAIADKYELDNQVRRRELIPADIVQETYLDHVANARAKFLALPSKIARGDKELAKRIKADIWEALAELAGDGLPRNAEADTGGNGSSVEAPAKLNA